jgi:hypothetical protein
MKKVMLSLVAMGVLVAPVLAKDPKKPADYTITLTNSSASALTAFNITEVVPAAPAAAAPKSDDWWMAPVNMFNSLTAPAPAAPTTRVINLLKKPVAAKKSVVVNLGKSCTVTVSASFEDGSSIDPVAMDLCKDKKLSIGG